MKTATAGTPTDEICDGLDNDCDGTADQDCGACCNFNGTCTDAVLSADCGGTAQIHTPQSLCEEIAGCAAVPTVSEWGLIVMTLLGVTAGTIIFGRGRKHRTA